MSAPFTVTARLDPSAGPARFEAPTPTAASRIAQDLLIRAPYCSASWGPTDSPDGYPWPVQVLVRRAPMFGVLPGQLHVALLEAGTPVGDTLETCCGESVREFVAEYTIRGQPCEVCLAYWRIAHDQDQLPPEEIPEWSWASIDKELLERLVEALRRIL